MTTHLHITTWVIAIILFFVSLSMYKSGNSKAKALHMATRVFYILIILSGFQLIGSSFSYYAGKLIMGIVVIALMEMTLVRAKKGKSTGIFTVIFVVAFLIILYMGLSMPQGLHPFS
ncbi:YisL family protein [Actinomycetes bacterium NPDC127524]|uniref:YisL family protein n=1 Tax=unclassified Bacillus (in: firmicutes) TaxID=185979 RepID=UPI0008E07FBC|nr:MULTISPECIES: YisL family protein [unclassified Bacillus (in: firmicutes)]OIK14093.1 hypothetical protein BIV59_03885 [Bacillus sp. MUM 13]SFB96646.1 Protein of unknown function [Bacillus sp. OV322]